MNTLPNTTLYRGIIYKDGSNKDKLINNLIKIDQNYMIDMTLTNYLSKIYYSEEDKIKFIKNNTFTENNFMSTSMNMNVAYRFSKSFQIYDTNTTNIILKIDIKKSDSIPFIFLSDIFWNIIKNNKNIKKINNWNKTTFDEFEILLPRGVEFKIVKVEDVKVIQSIQGFNKYYNKKNNYDIIKLVTIKPIHYKPLKDFKLTNFNYHLKI